MKKSYHDRYLTLSKTEQKTWKEIKGNLISNWTQIWREKTTIYANNIVVTEVESGNSFTYKELDTASESIANYIRAHIKDARIGLYHDNAFDFLAALIGINKTGRLAVLFNTREPMARVVDMASRAEVKVVLGNPIEGLTYHDIPTLINTPTQAPRYTADLSTTLEDPAFVIFTSGTSGPSKPALFSHRRMIGAGVAWSLRTFMKEEDSCYITLPLYHGNALAVAFSAVVFSGATAVLRDKFSVTHFFEDINKYKCSHMVYIGELWRYLLQTYHERASLPLGYNPNHSLHTIFGNGLNKELWDEVTSRYKIKHIVEHFGATEMPAAALTNWMDKAGFCGYIPPSSPEYNDVIMIDEEGKEVGIGEVGEAIFRVPKNSYHGYLDPALDAAKVLEREGNLWWRSGDLLTRNAEGFFTFIDRAGDSYRFKGENIASTDVETVLMQSGYCKEAVVYGITLPHIDGKIGMASLVLRKPLDTGFYTFLKAHLGSYAFPYIVRISKELHQTTSTLKIQKKLLASKGIENYHDKSHFILFEEKYRTIDNTIYKYLQSGEIILGKK